MKRIGILTAGGDTPALNATIHGAVMRANQIHIEIVGLIKGFNCLFNPRVPHVHLNPLYLEIPELDPTKGGTLIGSSRDYIDPDNREELDLIESRLKKLGIEGLICIGGDGTLNGLQPIAERLPTVLAPKTIDNDLGLNYPSESDEWVRSNDAAAKHGYRYKTRPLEHRVRSRPDGQLRHAGLRDRGVRLGHRRRAHPHDGGKPPAHRHHRSHGPAFGLHRPGHRLRPAGHHPHPGARPQHRAPGRAREDPLRPPEERRHRVRRRHRGRAGPRIGGGNQDERSRRERGPLGRRGRVAGADDPHDRRPLFPAVPPGESAKEAIFIRKVGHTQRGGRPILFDRFYAAQLGAKAVDLLVEGRNNAVSILQYSASNGFHVQGYDANRFRDRWGLIHPRQMHPAMYDPKLMKPSRLGIEYMMPIFSDAIGEDDAENMRRTLFAAGNLSQPYHSINTDVHKRIRYLEGES